MAKKKAYRELQHVAINPTLLSEIEARLRRAFKRELYGPLAKIMDEPLKDVENARLTALTKGLWSGQISYSRGVFHGRLTSEISREIKSIGGEWDMKKGVFRLPRSKAPEQILYVSSRANELLSEKQKKIDAFLRQDIPEKIAKSFKASEVFSKILEKVDTHVSESVKSITVTPKLSEKQKTRITENWSDNMDLYIQKFSKKKIRELRTTVQKSTFAGARREEIAEAIQKSYGVSERKAKFLAHQETRLLLAEYKASKYEAAGVTHYRWRCNAGSKNHPVRPSHKILDGQVFEYSKPPITTAPDEPARRNNPGQDYNCRCRDIPLIEI